MKVASLQPLHPLPPLPLSPAAPSAAPAPAAPRREPHGHEQPPHSGPSPALPPCLAESDVPLTPGATLTGLAAQPIAHKPAVHLSASPIATVAGPAPGPVSGLIFNHKAPVQVPLDLEPIACKPSPPSSAASSWRPFRPSALAALLPIRRPRPAARRLRRWSCCCARPRARPSCATLAAPAHPRPACPAAMRWPTASSSATGLIWPRG